MKDLILRIGGISIGLEAGEGLELGVHPAARPFLDRSSTPEALVEAVLLDEIEDGAGDLLFDSGSLWRLDRQGSSYRFRFTSPALGPLPYKVARFRPDFLRGRVELRRSGLRGRRQESPGPVDPLEYPLDELLVTHLLARGRGVEVHGCGVKDPRGRGLLFAGPSGAGKTTLARLWQACPGAVVLSDDRVVLRAEGGQVHLHGTPWHGEAGLSSPECAPLERIFFLRHGPWNRLRPERRARAASRLLAASFPPFHSREGMQFTLDFLAHVVESAAAWDFTFLPGPEAIDLLLGPGGSASTGGRSAQKPSEAEPLSTVDSRQEASFRLKRASPHPAEESRGNTGRG